MSGRARAGQATTEVVLLFPVFIMFLLLFAKVFGLLILAQKLEIASFYAGRRWQLESHRNESFVATDTGQLLPNIAAQTCHSLGYAGAASDGSCIAPPKSNNFLDLVTKCSPSKDCTQTWPGVAVQRTQVWNVVTVTACTKPFDVPFSPGKKMGGFVLCSRKYVPNRDRPIAFVLPGLQP